LGEEMTGGGTSRYVDSSVERVQVKVQNFVAERYILTCNGVKVPLSATGTKGEYVSGVRYKAWQPWSALHPTIGVDTPLVFDIVDLWNNHSIGGCTYFVAHPGGRTYETFPVNSYEAESRRINRFWDIGHTQGEVQRDVQQIKLSQESNVTLRNLVESKQAKVFELTELPISPEYPHILDLRQRWTIK
jgi:uncharacterized protein (DUF2126 family)